MISVAIISIIASIAVVKAGDAIGKAHDSKRLADGRLLYEAFVAFYTEHERLPGLTDSVFWNQDSK